MQTKSPRQETTLKNIEPGISQIILNFANDSKQLLKDNVLAEYLFGSYAKQTQTSLSDIDILIIVMRTTPDLQWQMGGLASEYSLKYQVCFSPILQDIQVWHKHEYYHTLFYQEVTKYGIRL